MISANRLSKSSSLPSSQMATVFSSATANSSGSMISTASVHPSGGLQAKAPMHSVDPSIDPQEHLHIPTQIDEQTQTEEQTQSESRSGTQIEDPSFSPLHNQHRPSLPIQGHPGQSLDQSEGQDRPYLDQNLDQQSQDHRQDQGLRQNQDPSLTQHQVLHPSQSSHPVPSHPNPMQSYLPKQIPNRSHLNHQNPVPIHSPSTSQMHNPADQDPRPTHNPSPAPKRRSFRSALSRLFRRKKRDSVTPGSDSSQSHSDGPPSTTPHDLERSHPTEQSHRTEHSQERGPRVQEFTRPVHPLSLKVEPVPSPRSPREISPTSLHGPLPLDSPPPTPKYAAPLHRRGTSLLDVPSPALSMPLPLPLPAPPLLPRHRDSGDFTALSPRPSSSRWNPPPRRKSLGARSSSLTEIHFSVNPRGPTTILPHGRSRSSVSGWNGTLTASTSSPALSEAYVQRMSQDSGRAPKRVDDRSCDRDEEQGRDEPDQSGGQDRELERDIPVQATPPDIAQRDQAHERSQFFDSPSMDERSTFLARDTTTTQQRNHRLDRTPSHLTDDGEPNGGVFLTASRWATPMASLSRLTGPRATGVESNLSLGSVYDPSHRPSSCSASFESVPTDRGSAHDSVDPGAFDGETRETLAFSLGLSLGELVDADHHLAPSPTRTTTERGPAPISGEADPEADHTICRSPTQSLEDRVRQLEQTVRRLTAQLEWVARHGVASGELLSPEMLHIGLTTPSDHTLLGKSTPTDHNLDKVAPEDHRPDNFVPSMETRDVTTTTTATTKRTTSLLRGYAYAPSNASQRLSLARNSLLPQRESFPNRLSFPRADEGPSRDSQMTFLAPSIPRVPSPSSRPSSVVHDKIGAYKPFDKHQSTQSNDHCTNLDGIPGPPQKAYPALALDLDRERSARQALEGEVQQLRKLVQLLLTEQKLTAPDTDTMMDVTRPGPPTMAGMNPGQAIVPPKTTLHPSMAQSAPRQPMRLSAFESYPYASSHSTYDSEDDHSPSHDGGNEPRDQGNQEQHDRYHLENNQRQNTHNLYIHAHHPLVQSSEPSRSSSIYGPIDQPHIGSQDTEFRDVDRHDGGVCLTPVATNAAAATATTTPMTNPVATPAAPSPRPTSALPRSSQPPVAFHRPWKRPASPRPILASSDAPSPGLSQPPGSSSSPPRPLTSGIPSLAHSYTSSLPSRPSPASSSHPSPARGQQQMASQVDQRAKRNSGPRHGFSFGVFSKMHQKTRE